MRESKQGFLSTVHQPESTYTKENMKLLSLLSKTNAVYLTVCFLCGTIRRLDAIYDIDACIDHGVCNCDNATAGIECACDASNDLTVWPFTLHRSHPRIHISGCGTVNLQTLSMSTYPPVRLEIVSVQRLLLQHFVFHNLDGSVQQLVFADTVIPSIDPYVFHQITHLNRLEFRNVTIGNIGAAAFGAFDNIGTISIRNSWIGSIDERAFVNITNVYRVWIVDSRIDEMAADAIVLQRVGAFSMLNVTFGHWSNRSLTLVGAGSVTVADCKIAVMADGALTLLSTDRLVFDGNHISWLRSNAFDGLRDASSIRLVGNRIERMDADALLPLLSKAIDLTMVNNSLPCGDGFCFLMEDADLGSFDSVLDGNRCLNDSRTLAEFSSLMDDEDLCRSGPSSGAGTTSRHTTSTPNSSQLWIPASQVKSVPALLLLSMAPLIAITSWSACISYS